MKTLGSWGRTIFRLRPAKGLEGWGLILRQRQGKVDLGIAELQAIAAFCQAEGIEPLGGQVAVMKKRKT